MRKQLQKLFFLITTLLFSFTLFAQQKEEALFQKEISQLNQISKRIIGSDNDEDKTKANLEFKQILEKVINHKASFDFKFSAIESISILAANNIKIYNWTLPKIDGTFEYFAILQIKSKQKNTFKIVTFTDQSETITSPERKALTPKNWYGALYYELINNKKLGENYYTLLGWDGNDKLTNKKIIETLYVSTNGIIKLGNPILKKQRKTLKRVRILWPFIRYL